MRYLTAGESHGPALLGIIEGLPAGLRLVEDDLNRQLARRQGGYGRGGRMSIEKDRVHFLSGIRYGCTTGAPLSLKIENKDWPNWQKIMSPYPPAETAGRGTDGWETNSRGADSMEKNGRETDDRTVTCPRPGHADLAGGIKYFHRDLRNVLERASARETAMRVAIGAVAAALLNCFQIKSAGYVCAVGGVAAAPRPAAWGVEEVTEKAGRSLLCCLDEKAEQLMKAAIDHARAQGDTLGGVFEILVEGLPPGLGSHVQADRRLDGRLAGALMSIPGIKGVEIGLGFAAAGQYGSQVHDALRWGQTGQGKKIIRSSNHAGGLEGGMTNGEPLIIRAAMKPIPTLKKALPSIDLQTGEEKDAAVERADVCAVAAAAVIGEAQVNWELARAFLEKFKGDSLMEIEAAWHHYRQLIQDYLGGGGV